MPEFRFQARLHTGEPVFGMRSALSAEELAQQLRAEGLLDVQLEWLKSVPDVIPAAGVVPRLVQLRVGDRLREAMLLQLPAHEMVRAVADEPFLHPLLMFWPWLTACSAIAALLVLLLTAVIPLFPALLFPVSLAVCALLLLGGFLLRQRLQERPRRLLRRLADELERGQGDVAALRPVLPQELRGVEFGDLDESRKTQLLAELIPVSAQLRLQRFRLAAALLSPFLIGVLLTAGLSVVCATLVPAILQILGGMNGEAVLPSISSWMFGLNITFCGVLLSLVLCVCVYVFTGSCESLVRSLPLLGRSLTWLSQAGFCRVLAIHLRQGGSAAVMVRSAAAVTCGTGIRKEATAVAAALEVGQSAPEFTGPSLNGVPLALLTTSDGRALPESDYRDTSDAFDGLAGAFEAASRGDAGFAALVFNIVIMTFCGLLLAAIWLLLLVPLLRMLKNMTGLSISSEWLTAGGLWS
ncbi:MAG: hypothetical protein ACKO2L_21105 [Planctomycetaceae bacterium]